MKIAFYSNFLNHHQLPLCQAFAAIENVEFTFVATEPIPKERLDMNYADMNREYPFVLRPYESKKSRQMAESLAIDADVVIIGSAANDYVESRLKKYRKLTYRFCERSLRKGTWRRFIPRTHKRIYREYLQFKDDPLYILGASAFTSGDLAICGFPEEKCYRWGYFPETIEYSNFEHLLRSKKECSIIWVGRFIECKHPEFALKIASKLKRSGQKFHMVMVGDGPLRKESEEYIRKQDLANYVELTGAISPEQVRSRMEQAEVFLFTSDFYEGWGAVVNEAMNSGCVPIISHACGSAPYLIEQGRNGYVYQYGSTEECLDRIKSVFSDSETSKKLGRNAYETMRTMWNADTAVSRLMTLTEYLQSGQEGCVYETGPCSPAPMYRNNWYKGKI